MRWIAHGYALTAALGLACSLYWRPRLAVHRWTLAFLALSLGWDLLGWGLAATGQQNHWLMNLWPPIAALVVLPLLASTVAQLPRDLLLAAPPLFVGFWALWTFGGRLPGHVLDDLTHPLFALLVAAAALAVLVLQAREARLPYWRRAATWAAAGLFLGHLVDVVAWVALRAALTDPGQAAALWTVRNALWCGCNLLLGWSFRWA